MKTLIATFITVVGLNVNAAEIQSGHYEKESDNIVLNVVYQGGCKEHVFKIKLNQCNRAMPATCKATLVDNTEDDVCRGFVQKTVVIPAAHAVGTVNIDQLIVIGDNETSAVIDFF